MDGPSGELCRIEVLGNEHPREMVIARVCGYRIRLTGVLRLTTAGQPRATITVVLQLGGAVGALQRKKWIR
jgi:hypothetical protein